MRPMLCSVYKGVLESRQVGNERLSIDDSLSSLLGRKVIH